MAVLGTIPETEAGMVTLAEAALAAGLSYRTAARLIEKNVIPQPKGYRGVQGAPVPLSAKEAHELTVIARLREIGLSMQAIKQAARFLRKNKYNPYSQGFFSVQGTGKNRRLVRVDEDKHQAMEVLGQPGQLLLFVEGMKK